MKYQSQYKQDRFLNEVVFKNKRNGVFVDIGANDGITYSNSYVFEKELGWTGLCVEPLENSFKRLSELRTCQLIKGAASVRDGEEVFFSVEGYSEMLSGLKSKYDERHLLRLEKEVNEMGGRINEINIECYDINNLLQKFGLFSIDFLSLDIEGGELEILRIIDYSKYFIKVIVVENNFKDPEFIKVMNTKGFQLFKKLGPDQIYLNKKAFSFLRRFVLKMRAF